MSNESSSDDPKVEVLPPTPGMRRKRRPHIDKLSECPPRQQKLIMGTLMTGSPTEGAKLAGYKASSHHSAAVMASRILAQPRVQVAFREQLNRIYPDVDAKVSERLKEILESPIKMAKGDAGITVAEFIMTANFVKDVLGWSAPKRSLSLQGKVKFLPE